MLTASTFAPATSAPVGSATSPWIEPVPLVWDRADEGTIRQIEKTNAIHRQTDKYIHRFVIFMSLLVTIQSFVFGAKCGVLGPGVAVPSQLICAIRNISPEHKLQYSVPVKIMGKFDTVYYVPRAPGFRRDKCHKTSRIAVNGDLPLPDEEWALQKGHFPPC
jgi:hypothetical protein